MRRNLQLFIAPGNLYNRPADLGDDAVVLYNWSNGDLAEPAQIKNSWSRQITLPGTPTNDILFGGMTNHSRATSPALISSAGVEFDPSVRTPFELFDDAGALLERGYLKLDEIVQQGADHSYKVTLFGGLGGFLVALSYDPEGRRRSLADLVFKSKDGAVQDLGFKIMQDTVLQAWAFLSQHYGPHYLLNNKWDFINFAPAYNGTPAGFFNANKAIADVAAAGIPSSVDGFTPLGGGNVVLASFQEALTEWETRDLRSYLQRPVVRLGAVLNAIADPENNGGYSVELDEAVFDPMLAANPYVWDTWITLPLLTTMKFHRGGTSTAFTVAAGENTIPSALFGVAASYRVELRPKIGAGSGNRYLECSQAYRADYINWVDIKVEFYNAQNVLLQTNAFRFGPNVSDDHLTTAIRGHFDATGAWTGNPAVMEWENTGVAASFAKMVVTATDGGARSGGEGPGPNLIGYVWTDRFDILKRETYSNTPQGSGSYNVSAIDAVRSFVDVKAEDLLRTENTPADYLLSFCKMLGLRLIFDPVLNKITVTDREHYYRTTPVTDISRRINRGKPMTTIPLTFDKRWYSFTQDYGSGEWAQRYRSIYGRDYGEQRVDTGYQFDAGTFDVMSGVVFRGAVQILESSKYFCRGKVGNRTVPGAFYDAGATYQLFDAGGNAKGFPLPYPESVADYSSRDGHPYFDVTDRPQFHGEGNTPYDERDTLIFLAGFTPVDGMDYRVTDDTLEAMSLNNNTPCWDLTGGTPLYEIPYFSRYGQLYAGVFNASLDFGIPAEVPIPDALFSNWASIYARSWRDFIADRLSIDTRTVRCHVNLAGLQVGQDLLRGLYYFDGAVWSLNKIINHSLTTWDDTECEFIKVQNVENY